jgi:hypothetical protein
MPNKNLKLCFRKIGSCFAAELIADVRNAEARLLQCKYDSTIGIAWPSVEFTRRIGAYRRTCAQEMNKVVGSVRSSPHS